MLDPYKLAEEYIRSHFAYSNATESEMEAARSAFVAGYEQAEENRLETTTPDSDAENQLKV